MRKVRFPRITGLRAAVTAKFRVAAHAAKAALKRVSAASCRAWDRVLRVLTSTETMADLGHDFHSIAVASASGLGVVVFTRPDHYALYGILLAVSSVVSLVVGIWLVYLSRKEP